MVLSTEPNSFNLMIAAVDMPMVGGAAAAVRPGVAPSPSPAGNGVALLTRLTTTISGGTANFTLNLPTNSSLVRPSEQPRGLTPHPWGGTRPKELALLTHGVERRAADCYRLRAVLSPPRSPSLGAPSSSSRRS